MILNIKKNKNGYAVLELIFYIAIFVILSILVIDAMITMTKSFRETVIQAELVQSGTIMEKISREIRASYGINSISASDLILNTKNDAGANKTVEFKFVGTDIQFWDAGSNIGNLNTPKIVVTALSFTQITTVKGKAVKISLTIKSANDALGRTQNFYDTIVLRGSY